MEKEVKQQNMKKIVMISVGKLLNIKTLTKKECIGFLWGRRVVSQIF